VIDWPLFLKKPKEVLFFYGGKKKKKVLPFLFLEKEGEKKKVKPFFLKENREARSPDTIRERKVENIQHHKEGVKEKEKNGS